MTISDFLVTVVAQSSLLDPSFNSLCDIFFTVAMTTRYMVFYNVQVGSLQQYSRQLCVFASCAVSVETLHSCKETMTSLQEPWDEVQKAASEAYCCKEKDVMIADPQQQVAAPEQK